MTGPDQERYHCTRCNRDFNSLDALINHPGCGDTADDDDPSGGSGSPRLVADGGHNGQPSNDLERFVEHPTPDSFFMQIEPAEVEMDVHDHDDVTFKTQHVPGGRFGVELSARFKYAGRDCTEIITLDRAAAESLYERLETILDADDRGER